MNLLAAKLYDPAVAVTKATSALLAMTALDTTNLRLAVTVPAHGMVRFRLVATVTGATTMPVIYLGVMNGSTVVARCTPTDYPGTASAATQTVPAMVDFVATGLTPGLTNFDAAYGVEVIVAATSIKYGGPNNATTNDAWGAFQFEAWDPQPMTPNVTLAVDASGRVDVGKVAGTAQTARDLGAQLDAAVSTRLAAASYTTPPTAAAVRTEMDANSTKLANLDATVSSRSTYAGGDTAGTTTLLTRLTSGRAIALDNLDAQVSTRLAVASYTPPPSAAAISSVVWGESVRSLTDKAGFSLATAPPTAAAIRAELDANSTKLANLDAAVSSRSTFNAGTTTVLADVAKVNGVTVAGAGTAGSPWGPA